MAFGKGLGHLRREIGVFGVGFLVLNGLIGAGIYALPAKLYEQAGMFSPWLFPLVGLLFITIIISFSELASYFNESGGPVLYNHTAFGPISGFQTGWFLYLSRMTAMAANVNVLIYYTAFLIPEVGDGWIRITLISVLISALALGNIMGVKGAMRILTVLSTLKLVPIFILILVGLPHVVPSELLPKEIPQMNDFGSTILILIYAFMGFEGALMMAGETKNARKTVPRALIITVCVITIFYFLVQMVYSSIAPPSTGNNTPLVALGNLLLGSAGAIVITLTAIFSVGGNLMGNMVAVPRMTYAMAEEGTLPKWFGILHKNYDTPINSIIFYAVLCIALSINGNFVWLAVVSSLARLIVFVFCMIALPVLRRKLNQETLDQAQRVPGGYLIPLIAGILCIWVASFSPLSAWLALIGLVAAGMMLYWISMRFKKT